MALTAAIITVAVQVVVAAVAGIVTLVAICYDRSCSGELADAALPLFGQWAVLVVVAGPAVFLSTAARRRSIGAVEGHGRAQAATIVAWAALLFVPVLAMLLQIPTFV